MIADAETVSTFPASTSESFNKTFPVAVLSSKIVVESFAAMGASFTEFIVMNTLAVSQLLVAPASHTTYTTVSEPK